MINYIEKGHGLHDAIAAAGYSLAQVSRHGVSTWECDPDDEAAIQAIIDSYDPLPEAREEAKARIVSEANAALAGLEASYPEFEKKTWPYQKAETEAYAADNSAPTPTIDAIAAQRGVDRVDLIATVTAKVAAYHALSSQYAGERQRLYDLIDAAGSVEAIRAIEFIPPE